MCLGSVTSRMMGKLAVPVGQMQGREENAALLEGRASISDAADGLLPPESTHQNGVTQH